MTALQLLATEFVITITNPDVWLSIGLALVLGGACWAFGTWVARLVGLLKADAPAGETLGVGLASGLMVLAAWWAAIWSGGRSSFTPVAVGFAIAIGLAVVRRVRGPRTAAPRPDDVDAFVPRASWRKSMALTALAGGVFVIAVALLYGSTMAPSPRDGVQPVEFNDEAFYAVLGRDLATTGTESQLLASGFSDLQDLPGQIWYHWAELWLASAVITVVGTAPMAARYLVVLPIVLLAVTGLTGTLVRRVSCTGSRRAYLFGVVACLFLAPVPFIPGPFFSSWAIGMIFAITLYGLSAAALLLALYSVAVLGSRRGTWALAGFVGSTVAFMLPAHLAVGALALIGLTGAGAIWIGQSLVAMRRLPNTSPVWRRTISASGLLLIATVLWGTWSGHALGASGGPPPLVTPFNDSWRDSVAITILGGGAFFAIPVAWFLERSKRSLQTYLYAGTVMLLIVGAIGWGARLGDFTMFYLFFAVIAVIATPVAAIATHTLWDHLQATHRRTLAVWIIVLAVIQIELGGWNGLLRLQAFGPHTSEPIPVGLLETIRRLPLDAKLAYTCKPLYESGFGVPQLISIDAHAQRRVVPMCFEAETLSSLNGAPLSERVENLFFKWAPQRTVFPSLEADPSSAVVAAFLKNHGVEYIYADAQHPNSLVDDALPIATSGDAMVLKIP